MGNVDLLSIKRSTICRDFEAYTNRNSAGDYTFALQANSCCCASWGIVAVVPA